jgi:hypothetical protein
VANPRSSATQVDVELRDANGALMGTRTISLPAFGHTAVNLGSLFSGLASNFRGTVALSPSVNTFREIVAWTVYADPEVITSLPPGRFAWPVPHWERIWTAFLKIHAVAEEVFPDAFSTAVKLKITDDKVVNAYAAAGTEVGVYTALSELIGDSDSELAFVIAHEFAHIWQQRTGQKPAEPELDADQIGTLLLLLAGYDPYAAAGVLGKLQVASGTPGLLGEHLRQEDIHRSFSTRIEAVADVLDFACSYSHSARQACQEYKALFHPHFPDDMPLSKPGFKAPR